MLILNRDDVLRALPMNDAIHAMKSAFTALGNDQVEMPVRTHIPVADAEAEWLIMPSYVGGTQRSLAVKIVGVFPNNRQHNLEPILGLINVADPETGKPVAIIEGASVTGIRTAAVSALATDVMARPDCQSLAVIGGGIQAGTHIEAICAVRPIKQLKIFSRTLQKVEKLIAELKSNHWFPANVDIATSADKAVIDADIVCACTNASVPVFSEKAISPGTHINAVGLHAPEKREIPGATVGRAKIVVDQKQVALHAGDLHLAIEEGFAQPDDVLELADIMTGAVASPRTSDEDVTFFKSVGLAMEDAVAAQVCLSNAKKLELGQAIDWS